MAARCVWDLEKFRGSMVKPPWNVTWRQPREELKYHKEQNLNLFASAMKELLGDFQFTI